MPGGRPILRRGGKATVAKPAHWVLMRSRAGFLQLGLGFRPREPRRDQERRRRNDVPVKWAVVLREYKESWVSFSHLVDQCLGLPDVGRTRSSEHNRFYLRLIANVLDRLAR